MKTLSFYLLAFVFAAACSAFAVPARGQETAATKASWELTPYRMEICVVVEPSAQLTRTFESELTRQLVAQLEAAYSGPWQVSAGKSVTKGRGALLKSLALLDDSPDLKGTAGFDKLLVVGVQERQSGFRITVRERETFSEMWNIPIERSTVQASRILPETLAAVQAASGTVLRIDSVDKDIVTVTLRGGSLPKRDGSFLAIDRNATFGLHLLQTDKQGKPNLETLKPLPWSFLTPINAPGPTATVAGSRATFKCRFHTAIGGSPIPEYHPLQLRLAYLLPKSTASTKLILVDKQDPQPPLEGYEVFLAPIDGSAASAAPVRVGVSNRSGEVVVPAGDGALRRLIISHGGEELFRRPYAPGLREEAKIALPSGRRRLELAADVAAAEDDLFDVVGRMMVLTARVEDAVKRRDVAAANRAAADTASLTSLTELLNRATELEKQLASEDPATRNRLLPRIIIVKTFLEGAKSGLAKGMP